LTHDPDEPEQDPVFFSFSNVVYVLQPPFLFHLLLYNELLLAAAWRKGGRGMGSCDRGLHPMLLNKIPSRTRVKKEGKRMSFIFQFLIVSRSWQLFWQSKRGSCG